MLIAGIDEAGRGPAVGPLVLAVAVIEKRDEDELLKIGVKDSKQLSEKQRNAQFGKIKGALSEFATIHILPEEIDSLRDRKSLNEIEAMKIGALLNGLKKRPSVLYVDAPDVIEENFAERIRKYVSYDLAIKSEHKADVNYPIVSAASIIAKVERDAEIEKLSKEHGEMGSGYPHDERTIKFLEKWLEKNKALPKFARASWDTNKTLIDRRMQRKLPEF